MAEPEIGGTGKGGQTTLAAGQRRYKPSEVGYTAEGGVPGLRCSDCVFLEAGSCRIVGVQPAPDGYCDEFEPNPAGGREASGQVSSAEPAETLTVSSEAAASVERGFSMFIYRVTQPRPGKPARWYATASGTKRDSYGERMSAMLFRDFIRRINAGEKPPPPWSSDAWPGGLPYLGVSHFPDLDGYGIVGDTEQIWVDGQTLKARGTWRDTPLAQAAREAVERDIVEDVPAERRVRISIAFLDYGHRHGEDPTRATIFRRRSLTDVCRSCQGGEDEKIYERGVLVHLALTRKPAYPETAILLEERSDMNKTKELKEDAASIVGEELAEELENRARVAVTRSSPALVVKAEQEPTAEAAPPEGEAPAPESGPAEGESEGEPQGEFGGARTIEDAEAWLVESGRETLEDAWWVLKGVLTNIVGEELGAQVAEQVDAFRDVLEVQAVDAIMHLASVVDRIEAALGAQGETEEAEEAQGEQPAERLPASGGEAGGAPAAVEQSLAALRSAVAAQAKSKSPDYGAVQRALNALAETIRGALPAPQAEAQSVDPAGIAEAVRQAVTEAMAPLAAALAGAGQAPKQEPVQRAALVPTPRAVRPAPAFGGQPTVKVPPVAPTAGTSRLRQIVRRSVGLE